VVDKQRIRLEHTAKDAGEDEVEDVPTDGWFPNRPDGIEFGVSEQFMLLRKFGVVLTLGDTDDE